jgi:hypothetical protein
VLEVGDDMSAHRLCQFDPTDIGLKLGVQMKELSPEAKIKFMTALAVASGEPWQKIETLRVRGRGYRREKCQCQISQFREPHRAPTMYACKNYANWIVDGYNMCGTHANAFVWERVLQENGYDAHSDGVLIQDSLRPSERRKEPTD